jgi:cytochrome c oxidase assembly protein subunit 15
LTLKPTTFAGFAAFAALLALAVIMVGAYVRLSDAGLGCPDWPGCYGGLAAPTSAQAIAAANAAYPARPVEPAKAWKEMAHRYLAGILGLAILLLGLMAWRSGGQIPARLPLLLIVLVVFQGLLGMWTVTLLVKPAVVTAHLAGGLATLCLLWWLVLRHGNLIGRGPSRGLARMRPWAILGLLLVSVQIVLGGWTSSNYAAVACTEFPTCYGGMWWPPADFGEAFVVWRGLGVDYEFGVLDSAARTAIHLSHRVGALVVVVYLVSLGIGMSWAGREAADRRLGLALLAVLALQVGLGIANVVTHLPLPVAVAHNGGAALLLVVMVTLLYRLGRPPMPPAPT